MTAVWRVARAAVRRRRLQTIVIGLVVWVCAVTAVMALGLLDVTSAPFDDAHAKQNGAHLVVAFDRAKVADARLAQTAAQPGVAAAAGPFGQTSLDTAEDGSGLPITLTTVGRADPGGPVDRLDVWAGHWATRPGEIVVNRTPGTAAAPGIGLGPDVKDPLAMGTKIAVAGLPTLTIVGYAYSVSGSADAWVTPEQLIALRPTATQMLYRFAHAATAADISAGAAAVTAGLAPDSVLGSLSYLTVKERITSQLGVFIPFLMIFGLLGLVVAVLLVVNVVSAAVVAGLRNIGMLKALGFTSNQVMATYLLMVSIPAVIGAVLGTVVGNLVAVPVARNAIEGFGTSDIGIAIWVDVVVLLGMPVLVALAALIPTLRARRLSASEAISAGSRQHSGRARRIQRWLSGTRLPRSVSLGLGLPFARPGRSLLTTAAVVLGVLTVTLSVGVSSSLITYRAATTPFPPDRVQIMAQAPARVEIPEFAGIDPKLSDAGDEMMLRSAPGAAHVVATRDEQVQLIGGDQDVDVEFLRGSRDDLAEMSHSLLSGHQSNGLGQVVVSSRFLNQRGFAVGDTLSVQLHGTMTRMQIVGVVLANADDVVYSTWDTLTTLVPQPKPERYEVKLEPGADRDALAAAVRAGDPGLLVLPPRDGSSSTSAVIISTATTLTVLLSLVAALGVFNTVVLNARERRRDLGMLKSIGMTPRQVTMMMVTSMGVLGLVGGLVGVPLGVVVHRVLVPAMAAGGQADAPDILVHVFHAPVLVLLALAGIVIAVLGAFIPARNAARLSIAAVLRNE